MTDKPSRPESLVERLRYDANNPPALPWPTPLLDEAADALERLRKGLEEASYALFQLKRMTPEAVADFARAASDKSQRALDGD